MSRPDYLDPTLSVQRRTEDLLSRMTLAEKAGQLFHAATSVTDDRSTSDEPVGRATADVQHRMLTHFNVVDGTSAAEIAAWHNHLQDLAEDTRLGIPVTLSSDPRHGFFSSPFTGQSISTVSRWPEHTGLAATRDPRIISEYGDTIRRELSSMGIRLLLGPMADLYTEPRWSRGYGTFGEDVDTAGRMTADLIRALRGGEELGPHSVATMVKHFPGGGPQQGGHDAHDRRYREQIYPGGRQELHLRPFRLALTAGVTQVMPYYGMPVGTDWPEVGFGLNHTVIQQLLRDELGFDGVVCTDWNLLEATEVEGIPFGPNGYGLEHYTPRERALAGITAGVDQFGGDRCPHLIVELVESGQLPDARLDMSVRRLLREKFRLGLFEQRRVDVAQAQDVCGSPQARAAGERAQRASLTLLHKNPEFRLPLPSGTRVYAEGVSLEDNSASDTGHGLVAVGSPAEADVNVIRLDAPWEHDPEALLSDMFHSGSLEFSQEQVQHIEELARTAPTVVTIYLERPAVLTRLRDRAAVLIGDYGVSDKSLIEALTDGHPFTGRLPFDLPRSDTAVAAAREDVPFDTADPLYYTGQGQS